MVQKCSWPNARSAVIGLGEVRTRSRDAGDRQRCATGVGQRRRQHLVLAKLYLPKSRLGGETSPPCQRQLEGTVCGLAGALSLIERVAVRVPICAGVKVTFTVQLAPGGTELPQLLVWEKSPESTPPMVMLVIVSVGRPIVSQHDRLYRAGRAQDLVGKSRAGTQDENRRATKSATAMSSLPSLLKSPSATHLGSTPAL